MNEEDEMKKFEQLHDKLRKQLEETQKAFNEFTECINKIKNSK